jgi:hypothetical protein
MCTCMSSTHSTNDSCVGALKSCTLTRSLTHSLTRLMHPLTHPPAHVAYSVTHVLAHPLVVVWHAAQTMHDLDLAQLFGLVHARHDTNAVGRWHGRHVRTSAALATTICKQQRDCNGPHRWSTATRLEPSPGHHHLFVHTNAVVMATTIYPQQRDCKHCSLLRLRGTSMRTYHILYKSDALCLSLVLCCAYVTRIVYIQDRRSLFVSCVVLCVCDTYCLHTRPTLYVCLLCCAVRM